MSNRINIIANNVSEPTGWYSHAYRVDNLIYTSGITAVDPLTNKIISPGNLTLQTEQVLKNLEKILVVAGSNLENVVKTLVFIADINKFDEFDLIYKKYFRHNPPARSTIEVGRFLNGMEIEVEAIAVVDDI